MPPTLVNQLLAAIRIDYATEIAVTAGLALISLAFVGFILRQAIQATKGDADMEPLKPKEDEEEEDER